uniref:Dynein light chain n=1 Tax=Schistosoma mansoni TaxID=6183 RepID=A0A5K4F771_SCHMA
MKRFRIHEKSIQIKKVTMDEKMQMDVISTVVAALHMYGNEYTQMKKFIESKLNKLYLPTWHYIIGYDVDRLLIANACSIPHFIQM